MEEFGKDYFERGHYDSYESLESKTKSWTCDILAHVKLPSGGKALDIGAAYGYHMEVLRNLGFEPYGVDISEYAVKKARLRGNMVKRCDAQEKIPFNHTFSLAISLDTLEHMERPENAILNCYHHLEDGGMFIAVTPNPNWWRVKLGLNSEWLDDETHKNVMSVNEWKKAFKTCDWNFLKVEAFQTIPILWRFITPRPIIKFKRGEFILVEGIV